MSEIILNYYIKYVNLDFIKVIYKMCAKGFSFILTIRKTKLGVKKARQIKGCSTFIITSIIDIVIAVIFFFGGKNELNWLCIVDFVAAGVDLLFNLFMQNWFQFFLNPQLVLSVIF